jgi:hypothetical protein
MSVPPCGGPADTRSPSGAHKIQRALRGQPLAQPAAVAAAYTVTVRTQAALLTVINDHIAALQEQVEAHLRAPGR